MSETLFNNTFDNIDEFSRVGDNPTQRAGLWEQSNDQTLWSVDDRVADNPTLRFQRSQNSFAELIYDNGSGSVMNLSSVPEGLVNFIENKFIKPLRVRHTKHVSVEEAVVRSLSYLDWQEPYFFLIDMPIALTQDNYAFTYKNKETGSVLNPEKLETFAVQRNWKFEHYTHAARILSDERVQLILNGHTVMNKDNTRPMTVMDILFHVSEAVFGSFTYLQSCVSEWSSGYYEDLKYDQRTIDTEMVREIEDAEDLDQLFWLVCVIGTFTWLKSPYGLKFLQRYHPVYYELIDWDEERNVPVVTKGTDGWCVIDGWSIYTARDLVRLEAVKPGTCCVSNQQLHCTERINAKAVLNNCYCGKPRDIHAEDYWADDRAEHRTSECKRWEKDNPPQMVYVSYAAMYNILNKMDPQTRCQRHACPKTSCTYHAGNYARVRALTERRTKMLTGPANN